MAKVTGGEAATKALQKIADQLDKASVLQVGFMENATYPDGTLVAMVAAVQEYGSTSRGIPPRPFFREMINEKSPEWPKAVRALLKANNYDTRRTLEQVGMAIKGQLQEKITTFVGVPLSPVTIARKGFDKQLIDTSHMLHSVEYEVK